MLVFLPGAQAGRVKFEDDARVRRGYSGAGVTEKVSCSDGLIHSAAGARQLYRCRAESFEAFRVSGGLA